MVKDKRVKRFKERLYCDICEDEVKLTKEEFDGKKIVCYYWCENCSLEAISDTVYPRTIEKEVD